MRKIKKILAVGQDFPPPAEFHLKFQGKGGTVQTWWMQHFFDIFGKKGDIWDMILGDNPAGHGFV